VCVTRDGGDTAEAEVDDWVGESCFVEEGDNEAAEAAVNVAANTWSEGWREEGHHQRLMREMESGRSSVK